MMKNDRLADNEIISRRLTTAAFQKQIFEELLDFFKQIRIRETAARDFIKREPAGLLQYSTTAEYYLQSKGELYRIIQDFPQLKTTFGKELSGLIDAIKDNDKNAFRLLDTYLQYSQIKARYYAGDTDEKSGNIRLKADDADIYIEVDKDFIYDSTDLKDHYADNVQNKLYLSSIMDICKKIRCHHRAFTNRENSAIWFAYSLIKSGVTLDFAYRGLATSGFRKGKHILIFSTDPGDDHIRTTSVNSELLDGVAVHVEHIDRDMVTDKEKVEAYRLPAAINAAKVRLHISDDAPVTVYIGRPIFENGSKDLLEKSYISHKNYQLDKLKSVHLSASACTTMFQNGFADCKIAIERMQVSDAIEFMKSVVGNTIRDRTRQTLAAAFNINTPIYDDRYEKREITDRFEIASKAIQITLEGGFDRVTWDGADTAHVPSIPVIDQMEHRQFVELVHRAHENGLQTYFSAGLNVDHIERCVNTGVDGLGIGTSLHYMDKVTKLMGSFNPGAITGILKKRNEAEDTVLGKGAILLARLDRLFFEEAIFESEDRLRIELYNAILDQDGEKVRSILADEKLKRVKDLPPEEQVPIMERALRAERFYDSKIAGNVELTDTDRQKYREIKSAISLKDIKKLEMVFNI